MKSRSIKLVSSFVILVMIFAGVSITGLTSEGHDASTGVMIDFGYYDVQWVPMILTDGMTGTDALLTACSIKGMDVVLDLSGNVRSVNGNDNLYGASWGLYVLRGSNEWTAVEDPNGFIVSEEAIIAWARATSSSDVMPGSDSTGYTYNSYAKEGYNGAGEKLRIMTLAPSVTETVVSVGGMDYIVGTDLYSTYPKELMDLRGSGIKTVGGYTDPNYELIVADMPDLVFLDGSVGEHVSMAEKLRKSGVKCVVLYEVKDISDLLKNIWICACAIGFPDTGNGYILKINATIDEICSVADVDGSKVFVSLGTESPYTAGSDTYMTSIINYLGAVNVFDNGKKSWYMPDKEQIYNKQPEFIIIIHQNGSVDSPEEYWDIVHSVNDLWKQTPAYRNGNIYIFSGGSADLISRPGSRLPAAMELMAKVLDPDSFKKMDKWFTLPKYFGDDYQQYLKYQKEGMLS